jgi:serine 3-dehydrogenase
MIRTAFVTGATSGFGAACARRFAAAGWKVVITGRRAERMHRLARELGGGTVVHCLNFDLRDGDAIAAAVAALPAAFADIDVLVNNAGLALGTAPAQAASLDDWHVMIDTNITGLVTITRRLLPTLMARRGAIISLASIAANWPYPGGNVYGATKAFVQQFSLGLRCDLQGSGVRVTSIGPGLSETEFTQVRTGGGQAVHDELYAGAVPLQPEDIAETIYWVATLPAHINVNTMELMPVSQSWAPFHIHRRVA